MKTTVSVVFVNGDSLFGTGYDDSRFISMLFHDFKEYLIDQRRRMYPDTNYYHNLEKLVNKLQ